MASHPPSNPQRYGAGPGLWRYAGMGLELGAAIVGFTLIGWWVDYSFGTGRTGVLVGALLGILGGGYNFVREAVRLGKETALSEKKRRAAHESASEAHDFDAGASGGDSGRD